MPLETTDKEPEYRVHTIILYGTMRIQEESQRVVAKVFREGGDVTIEKAARVSNFFDFHGR